jgi:hypothetical protein
MDLTENIQRLKEEIYYLCEGMGSIGKTLQLAKKKRINLNYGIPDHMWPDIEAEIDEDLSEWVTND